jgi:hypothetical protein
MGGGRGGGLGGVGVSADGTASGGVGAVPSMNKTWVRQADMESSLTSSR